MSSLSIKSALVGTLVAPPLAALTNLQIMYTFAGESCRASAGNSTAILHVASAIALFVTIAGSVIAWRLALHAEPGTRTRAIAWVGFSVSVTFGLVVVAEWIPVWYFAFCTRT